jgi:hypothetical protein
MLSRDKEEPSMVSEVDLHNQLSFILPILILLSRSRATNLADQLPDKA